MQYDGKWWLGQWHDMGVISWSDRAEGIKQCATFTGRFQQGESLCTGKIKYGNGDEYVGDFKPDFTKVR